MKSISVRSCAPHHHAILPHTLKYAVLDNSFADEIVVQICRLCALWGIKIPETVPAVPIIPHVTLTKLVNLLSLNFFICKTKELVNSSGDFVPQGHLAIFRYVFASILPHKTVGGCYWHLVVGGQGCC